MMARSSSSSVASSIALACVLAVLPGCVRETVNCADQPSAVCPDSGVPEDAQLDANALPDAFVEGDAGPCSRCPSTAPVCVMDRCVACVDDDTCPMDEPRCDTTRNECRECLSPTDCMAPTPGCSAAGACVTCSLDTHCPSPTGSRCDTDTNDCGPCIDDDDCRHIAGLPYCVRGACVACTPATEATDCMGTSCNPTTNTCTTTPVGMTRVCLPCVADSECVDGHTCAAVDPERGTLGTYCLPRLASRTDACARPFFERVVDGTSASGATVTYCRHRTTTCEAFVHYSSEGTGGMCTGTGTPVDDACGASGVADGVCRPSSGGANRCTYGCGGDDDCPCGGPGPTCPIRCTASVCSI